MTNESRIGQTFHGCTIRRLLGRGAKGVVYEAHQSSLDRSVAVKLLPRGVGDEGIKTLMAEARALAKINAPNVLKVYEVGVEQDTPFIIMEYLEGETLQQRMNRAGKLPVEAVLKLASEVAEGLSAAHRARIIHRDLKPSNVFLRPSQALKIIDFGLAYLAADGRESGGTPEFMAPEQWKFAAVDGRTDLYALGLMMFRMLTGRSAFGGTTLQEMANEHLKKRIPLPLTHSPKVSHFFAIIEQLAQKDPAARYPTATIAREDIERLRAGQRPQAAQQYGAPIVCDVCDEQNAPNAATCPCGHDLGSANIKVEELLPDPPAPQKQAKYPKGIKKRLR